MLDPAKPRPELKALTAMRGIAALAVVLQHFAATAQLNTNGWIPSPIPHGYMAVDFFFVLSGFIMCYTYLAGFEQQGMRAYGPFLWKRVARIFPLGIAMTAIIALCWSLAAPFGYGGLFAQPKYGGIGLMILVNVLHLQGFLPELNLNDPSWSVSVELAAYLLFPLLLGIVFRVRPLVAVLIAALGVAAMLWISSYDPTGGLAVRTPGFDLMRCVVEFSFGMMMYRAYAGRLWLHVLGRDPWTWTIGLLAAASLLVRNDLLIAATFPFLVLAFALNRGGPGRLMSHPVLHYLGVISFSIYLVHNIFRVPVFWLARTLHPAPLPPMLALGIALVSAIVILPVAALAYRGIERPGRTALNSVVKHVAVHLPARRRSARPAD